MRQNKPKNADQAHSKSPSFERLFLILFVFLLILIFVNSGLFTVRDFVVQGNQNISTEDILLSADLNHENIFQVNLQEIKEKILKNPKIASVEVQKIFPNKLLITINERRPLCMILYRENFVVVGNDLVVMEIRDKNTLISLPIITGIIPKKLVIGKPIHSSEYASVLDIFKNVDETLRQYISEINVTNYQIYLDLPNCHHTIKVDLGNPSQMEKKMYNLRAILSQTSPEKLAKIDLRVPGAPTAIKLSKDQSK
jgi:cell division protein FtsQ